MADLGKQFLDTDGLNALWTKHKKVQPFYQELGTSGTNGWVNFLTVKATTYMNHPLVVRLLCRGYSDSTMDVQFVSANNTTPTIQYFKQRIQPYSGTQAIPKPGYTYEDVDGVRYYKFWLKKNEASGSIGVHVESEYFYTTGAEDTGILTFPNVQSDTEPSGIVYVAAADIVYEAVPAKTAVSAAAVKVGTNVMGQVVLGNALAPSDLGISATTTSVTVGSTTANIPQGTTTTPKMDGTAAVGTETKWAKGDHVHPTDTSRAPTSHASSATTYGVGTSANYGHVKLATGDMNGATHADGVAVSKNHTHSQYVPTTRKVNGHALSADVTVTAADVSSVRYDTASQGLTDTQKSNARTNIGAGTSNLTLGTTSTTAAKGDHTHTTSIAADSSSDTVVTLAHNTQYKLTAGGTSVLFKTPADNNTDTKVTQSKDDSGTTAYPLLMAGAADPNGTATTARYDSAVKLTPSTNTISANISGNAATATSAGKLSTGRELAVGLSNTSTTTTFDGSANVTNIKVSGQLQVANGGTGSNTAAGARTNLSVYSKSEIDSLMSGRVEIVTELPATGKSGITYYVGPTGSGADKYDEYIWTGSAFLKVGEHSLDLSNYVNTVTTSGSGPVVTGVSKSGNTVTVTKGNISLDDLSDWATETDVTISNVTYHTMWPVAPTTSNQVYGISINNGRLFRIYNNKGAYSVQAYDKDSDTTYTPQKLGIGYGTCTTAEATAAKVVTLTDYTLVKNGIVAVKFSYPLCASATLNINGKGAKPVYVGGAAVTSTNCKSVQAGDIGYFIYDGTAYHFLGTDRVGKSSITGLSVSGRKVTYTRADGETGSFDTQDTTYAFADGYNASTNKGATVATVANAINALDVTDISGFGAGKTLSTLKEENGKISATFQNISITKSQVSDFSHAHGNIQNGGTLQTNDITIANGDKLVVTDSSDSSKVARASISFDGSTTTKALTPKGTFEAFAKSGDITTAIQALDVSSVGGDGKYISAISETDGKISAAATTMDTTPTANSTKAVTSGGIKTALDGKSSTSHTHGNITNDGKIGSTANLPVVTGTSGAVTTGTWATSASDTGSISGAGSANTFARGDHTHKVAVATGDSAGQVKVAGQNATVNGWDALTDRVDNLEESGDVGFMGNATQDGERLIFEDIIFDSIYPSIGKYGLATFPETTSADATEFSGDRDWLLDWRPYLVDMSPVAGETAKAPVAELRKDNWLRTKDGDYAPVCGITSAQSTALDGKKDTLYWKSGSTGDKVSATIPEAFDSSGKFVPAKFWEYVKANLSTVNTKAGVTYSSPIAVKVYVGTQAYEFGAYTNYHIPAPWETTETKYSVFIGRPSDVYVVDGYSATTGEHMRGLTAKPLPVGTNKFDPEDYRLRRTGISPGPSTVVASKIRNFFYNYVVAASSGCTVNGNAGRTSIFYNNGTYPATNGPTQYRCADWSRACNSGGSSGNAVPVGEMGYHALNAFLCSVEAAYGTRNIWEYNRFSEGICSNYGADATKGGVYLDGTTWKNWNTREATLSSTSENYSVAVNSQYAKFQCMEPQIAASIATEMGVSAGSSFHWNGGDWHFEVPSNLGTVMTLGQGAMNCRMYKLTDSKTVNGHTVRCNLVCALAEGVNPVGDIWCYYGGGAELVYLTDGTGNQNYKASFYLEPDQSRWLATSTTEKITSGTFAFESAYMKLLDSSTAGGLGNTYCLARTGYTPVRRISGGAYNSGECTYQYRQIDDDARGSAGIRSRRRLIFRGNAASTYCSPRCLNANYRPSRSSVNFGCSAQVLLA